LVVIQVSVTGWLESFWAFSSGSFGGLAAITCEAENSSAVDRAAASSERLCRCFMIFLLVVLRNECRRHGVQHA